MERIIVAIMFISLAFSIFGASVSGRVTDEDGAPFPWLSIFLDGDWISYSETTDDAGYYIFRDIPVGFYWLHTDWSVFTIPSDYEIYVASDRDSLTGYDFTVIMPPEPDALIRGRITYADGSPAYDIEVQAWGFSAPFSYYAYSDDIGNYEILVPGGDTYFVRCYPWGPYTVVPDYYAIPVGSGDTLDGYDFVLYPDTVSEMVISVFVGDPYYVGIAGVQISVVMVGGGFVGIDYTDEYGYAYFDIFEPGFFAITPELAGYTFYPASDTVYIDEHEPWVHVEFLTDSVVSPPYGIGITAFDSLYMPVESLFIEWRPSGGTTWDIVMTDQFGYAFIYLVHPGSYDLRAFHHNPLARINPTSITVDVTEFDPFVDVIFTVWFVSGIDEQTLPEDFDIIISPNPFNSVLRITGVNGANIVSFAAYNIDGKLIDKVHMNIPQISFDWTPPAGCPTGIYLLKIDCGDKSFTKKAILAK